MRYRLLLEITKALTLRRSSFVGTIVSLSSKTASDPILLLRPLLRVLTGEVTEVLIGDDAVVLGDKFSLSNVADIMVDLTFLSVCQRAQKIILYQWRCRITE